MTFDNSEATDILTWPPNDFHIMEYICVFFVCKNW